VFIYDFASTPDANIEPKGHVWVDGGCNGEWVSEEKTANFFIWLKSKKKSVDFNLYQQF
jgi:hypothetical protein